jgi:HSP20 family molecular chaperone IbpA
MDEYNADNNNNNRSRDSYYSSVYIMMWELTKELSKRSREFFEFVMPAIDMFEDGNDLIIRIDLPGFAKENITLRIVEDILTVNAKREEQQEHHGIQYYKQRPLKINRKVFLPILIRDGKKVVGTAKHQNGVITLRIPIPTSSSIPIT